MREKRIQGTITTGRWTLPVVILICTVCWAISAAVGYGCGYNTPRLPFGLDEELVKLVPEWISRLAGFVVFAVIGYFLIELNNVYAIIRTRATVQTSFFFLLVASCPALHTAYTSITTTIPLILSVFMLFRSYHAYSDAPGYVFVSFMLMAVASMLSPKIFWLIPVWFIGMVHFRALSLRSICAALLGIALPYWFLLAHTAFYKQMELFTQPFVDMFTLGNVGPSTLPTYGVTILGYMFVLYVGSLIQFLTESYKDKLQTHSYLGFTLWLMAYSFAVIMLQPEMLKVLLTTMMICCAILSAHLFVLTNTKASNIFFIIMTVGLATIYIINMFNL